MTKRRLGNVDFPRKGNCKGKSPKAVACPKNSKVASEAEGPGNKEKQEASTGK